MALQERISYYYNTPYPPSIQPQQTTQPETSGTSAGGQDQQFCQSSGPEHQMSQSSLSTNTHVPGLYTTVILPASTVGSLSKTTTNDPLEPNDDIDESDVDCTDVRHKQKRKDWMHKWESHIFSSEEMFVTPDFVHFGPSKRPADAPIIQ
ncbi:hypothetical protein CVT26_003948 [Gymnopilus dilepis]|uniref:Uncharacterized protein n=1 Tax=Gymnopilus dilepis TaxID=231916 RepID=A0A409WTR1_9AGAR|nr:hypothetical protein CVT26_003948 [Gymnopilus dilepis]